jgi:hypothetical protein
MPKIKGVRDCGMKPEKNADEMAVDTVWSEPLSGPNSRYQEKYRDFMTVRLGF